MVIDYSEMTEEQISIINEYCKDDMRKLKQICYFVWGKKGLPNCYHDDLYDDAMNVLSESVITFNPDGGASFKTYLTNNIHMSYGQWYRDTHLRSKRSNLLLDENGKIKFYDFRYKNIIIEFNGDYWHGNPIIYKENDIVKVYYNKQDPNHNDMLEGKGNIIIALFSIGVIIMSIYSMVQIKSNKIA